MSYRIVNMLNLALLLFEISILSVQGVPNTSSNQGAPLSSVQPKLFDLGAMGFPNFGPGRFGNPTSNYPTNPFFPNGNQNNNLPQNQGSYPNGQGGYPNGQGGYPNQNGFPYQGNNMNPNANYPGSQFPIRPNDGSMYPNQGNFQNRPISGGNSNGVGYPNQQGFPFQGNNMNGNFQNPQYPSGPNNPSLNTGINRPFQNGGMLNQGGNFNQGFPGQGGSRPPFQNPSQGGQYPNQGGFNPDFRPDDLSNLNPKVQFPGNERPYQNQYNPQTGLPYNPSIQNYPGFGQQNNFQTYPSNNINGNNVQFPSTYPNGNRPGQFPNPDSIVFPDHTNMPDNYTNGLQNGPFNNQGTNFNTYPNNRTVSILGKPVIVPPTLGQGLLNSSTENPKRRKCIQDCPATTEYNPICGTNNVTYINPGKFICARNCGEVVYLQKQGRCDGVAPKPSH